MAPGDEAVAGWLLPLLLATDVDNLTSRVRVNLLLSSPLFLDSFQFPSRVWFRIFN